MLKLCPFVYRRYNPETGKRHATVDNVFPDDKETKRPCNMGKGPWCGQCMHYNQWKVSDMKWKKIYNRIGKEKKVPHLWSKPRPARIVNPLDLKLNYTGQVVA